MALAVVVASGVAWAVGRRVHRPVETVFTPKADAYVSTAHPNTNFGTRRNLRIDATPRIRSYLSFRVAGLSGRVVKAELRLWSQTGSLVGYSLHPVPTASWDELEITSRNGPAPRGAVARSGPFGPGTWTSVDVTGLVKRSAGVSLALTTTSTQGVTFDSHEGAHGPQLVVQTTPGPSALHRFLRDTDAPTCDPAVQLAHARRGRVGS